MLADNETTAVEDWMAAQGHSTRQQNISMKQRLRNAYIEFKWGWAYYNFPWNWGTTLKIIAGFGVFLAVGQEVFRLYIAHHVESLPANDPKRPRLLNDLWRDDDPRDILSFIGIRKSYPSDQSRGGMYHLEDRPLKKPYNPDIKYSESLYTTWRDVTSFSKNKDRHERLKFQQKLYKLETLLKRKTYDQAQIALVEAVQESRRRRSQQQIKSNPYSEYKDYELLSALSDFEKDIEIVDKELDTIRTAVDATIVFPAKF